MPNALTAIEPLRRTSLRIQTQERVRSLILAGRLAPSTNVIERDLSARLGISRTPLREALLGLQTEGLLRAEPGRGFFVSDLSVEEARELYPLIWTLESMAVERGRPTDLAALARTGAGFRGTDSPDAALTQDRAWHEELISRCGCPRTAAILEGARAAAARYEYGFFSNAAAIRASAAEHDAILRELRKGRFKKAAALLKHNWRQGLEWVEQNYARTKHPGGTA
jgi:DNA-binding GntR family transcriptional regulator